MNSPRDTEDLRNVGLAIIAFGVVLAMLTLGASFLVPLAIAVLLWNLLGAVIDQIARVRVGRLHVPRWLATILGLALIILAFYMFVSIIMVQADQIAAAWPRYVSRFESIVVDIGNWLGPEWSAKLKTAVTEIDLTRRVPGLIASAQTFLVGFLLVMAYVGFLFAEGNHIGEKLTAMFPDEKRCGETNAMLTAVSASVRRYTWIKTVVSVLTGVSCYLVLRVLGIDFAETWALLIFLLNYIPNIGSIIGVAFPALIALVQFDTPAPFLILVLSLTAIQLAVGSVLEPMLMGSTLNMSPFAIILGLAFWGTIWGVVGMFLSVPIMVLIMIVCSHVPSWRWVAIMLSRDGHVIA